MKYLIIISIVVAIAVVFSSCKGQSKAKEGTIAKNVKVEEFASKLSGAQVLDVRTPDEWNEGIIKGATMANFYESDFEAQLGKLDKDKPVAVYCKSGGRSGKAMARMNEMGFKEVYNLDGGIGAWNGAGKPTVKP